MNKWRKIWEDLEKYIEDDFQTDYNFKTDQHLEGDPYTEGRLSLYLDLMNKMGELIETLDEEDFEE